MQKQIKQMVEKWKKKSNKRTNGGNKILNSGHGGWETKVSTTPDGPLTTKEMQQ